MDPQFYAFRWITLCLAQEFAFPDTLRIWDTMLSDPHGRMDCLLRICTSMIILARDRLMKVRDQSGSNEFVRTWCMLDLARDRQPEQQPRY